MTGQSRRARVDHAAAAATARTTPGQWVLAGIYPSSASAKSAARRVPLAELVSAYEPAGAYQAETGLHDDGYSLWVRYVGGPSPGTGPAASRPTPAAPTTHHTPERTPL